MTELVIEELQKIYADRETRKAVHAIRGVSLRIASGELVSLLGPSGCGKTTTLRCIAGFENPDAGAIRFDGSDMVRRPPEQRDIGLVFQNYALFPHMTVAQNISFGLEMRRIEKAQVRRRVGDVLDMVQLSQLEDRYPRQLSGGQQQRVALARALVIEPKILLLDEPLANLDAKLRDEMRFFIRSLQQRVGITTVYVTHDQAEAMVMSDRIVVMFDGTVSQFGAPSTIYGRPASRQVANFVGLSNFIPGRIVSRQGETRRCVETPVGKLQCLCEGTSEPGADALLVLRPESVTLSLERPGAAINQFQARVRERHRRVVQLRAGKLLADTGRGGRVMTVAAALPLPVERSSPRTLQWSLLVLPALALVIVFLLVPYLNIVVMSFRTPSTTAPYAPGFNLANYVKALSVLRMDHHPGQQRRDQRRPQAMGPDRAAGAAHVQRVRRRVPG